jgi:hypothetical protein
MTGTAGRRLRVLGGRANHRGAWRKANTSGAQ